MSNVSGYTRKWKDWLLSIPDDKEQRQVILYIDMGHTSVQVGKISLTRANLKDALDKFDSLNYLVFPVGDEEDDDD